MEKIGGHFSFQNLSLPSSGVLSYEEIQVDHLLTNFNARYSKTTFSRIEPADLVTYQGRLDAPTENLKSLQLSPFIQQMRVEEVGY